MAASIKVSHLSANIGTTVDDAWSYMRSVSEFSGFIVDLRSQLSSGRKDEGKWVEFSSTSVTAVVLFDAVAGSTVEDAGEHGQQEGGSFSGTSLGTRHQISSLVDDWDGVLLDGGRGGVVRELDRFVDDLAEIALLKGANASWWIFTGHFCGDVVVLFKVDAGVGAFEELLLESFVSWKRLKATVKIFRDTLGLPLSNQRCLGRGTVHGCPICRQVCRLLGEVLRVRSLGHHRILHRRRSLRFGLHRSDVCCRRTPLCRCLG